MRRSEALTPLSRDHHHGLFVALRLRRATPDDAAEAQSLFLEFWRTEGARHFRVEEEVLLPALARHTAPDHDAIVRTLVEHVDVRRRANALSSPGETPLDALHDLGALLNAHIRYEENVLFSLVEDTLTADELNELFLAIERAED